MRKLFVPVMLILFMFLFVAGPAMAQEAPKAELFGGYEYLRLNPGGGGCHGFGANIAYNVNDWLGAVGDLGVCKETGLPAGISLHDVNHLFGPRFSYRSGRKLTPFAQVLFGGQHEAGNGAAIDTFAMTLGGGADYVFTSHVSFRGQVEYLYTHFGGVKLTLGPHFFRISLLQALKLSGVLSPTLPPTPLKIRPQSK